MKSTIIPKDTSLTLPYPKLMEGTTGIVVLFSKPDTGVVVNSTHPSYEVGFYCTNWTGDCFVEYTGKVTLENS